MGTSSKGKLGVRGRRIKQTLKGGETYMKSELVKTRNGKIVK